MKAKATITEITLRALKAPDKGQHFYADGSVPGFGIRVSQGGTKTFVLLHGEPRRRLTIGRFPTISLSDARKIAKERLAENTLNRFRAKPITFDEAKKNYLEQSARKNRPRTVGRVRMASAELHLWLAAGLRYHEKRS